MRLVSTIVLGVLLLLQLEYTPGVTKMIRAYYRVASGGELTFSHLECVRSVNRPPVVWK